MNVDEKDQTLLKRLPGIDHILELMEKDNFPINVPRSVRLQCARKIVAGLRADILSGQKRISEADLTDEGILQSVRNVAHETIRPRLVRTINATGVVLHTNMGRSLLCRDAVANMAVVAAHYSNLEFNLASGKRGSRYSAVEEILCELSGAEAAIAVNNNAGAVLLCLDTLARGKNVIVSRGELVEIGGAFRIPDVMAKSGGILKEVGTTNRTHLKDYELAIDSETALLLKVHTSNYAVVGFTASVSLKELVALGKAKRLPVMEDLGSGTLIDFSKYGMRPEPTVQQSIADGADLVTFSGDKLLGGPQAGIITGKATLLEKIKKNSLTRALRIDKLTLAALESTLRQYRDESKALAEIPTLRMLTCPLDAIRARAQKLHQILQAIGDSTLQLSLCDRASRVGGGAFPLEELPSRCVGIRITGMPVNAFEKLMRLGNPPVIGRIEEDVWMMDMRTVQDEELVLIGDAVAQALRRNGP